jgi:hypothetical protein
MSIGRFVDVCAGCEALTATLDQLGDGVVSIDGRLLGEAARPGELYICVTTASRREAMKAVLKLLSLSLEDDDLRDALCIAGQPSVAAVGEQYLIWWCDLRGRARVFH